MSRNIISGTVLKYLEQYNGVADWFSLVELWTSHASNMDGDPAGSARWGLSLHKSSSVGSPLFWHLYGEWMQPASKSYQDFWAYDNKTYASVFDLFDAATIKQDYNPKYQFWFNDDVFSKINWKQNPSIKLETLYKIRAQQLRDKYDYLILAVSGGSDSRQMLKSFIDNNIFVDEVVSTYPLKLLEKTQLTKDPMHPMGLIFEYEYAAMPLLKELSEKSPNTKITIKDYSDFLEKKYTDSNTLISNENSLSISTHWYVDIFRIYQKQAFYELAENTKKPRVAVVNGSDKPYLLYHKNGSVYFHFLDLIRHLTNSLR